MTTSSDDVGKGYDALADAYARELFDELKGKPLDRALLASFVEQVKDVQPDGSLTRQREFGTLRGGQGGDGSAVDTEGRLYVATGASADVFAPNGQFLGSIPGPRGMHGVAFGGADKKTLFGIVFYGGWGTPSARNQVVAIPTIAQGVTDRAK